MSQLFIRFPNNSLEYEMACELVEKIYKKKNYIERFNSNPELLLIAVNSIGVISGAVGIYRCGIDGLFPTEEFFDFKINQSEFSKEKTIELCRLATLNQKDHFSLLGLLTGVYMYCQEQNVENVIACLKPSLLAFLQRLGLKIYVWDHKIKNIPKIYEGYFFQDPQPVSIALKIEENDTAIKNFMLRAFSRGLTVDLQKKTASQNEEDWLLP